MQILCFLIDVSKIFKETSGKKKRYFTEKISKVHSIDILGGPWKMKSI